MGQTHASSEHEFIPNVQLQGPSQLVDEGVGVIVSVVVCVWIILPITVPLTILKETVVKAEVSTDGETATFELTLLLDPLKLTLELVLLITVGVPLEVERTLDVLVLENIVVTRGLWDN